MNWRPEGWKNPIREINNGHHRVLGVAVFEDGADAMLEALKKDYKFMDIHDKEWYLTRTGGTWVFIPDEMKPLHLNERPPTYHKGQPCPYSSVTLTCQENDCGKGCQVYLDNLNRKMRK
jgi:hypothetical protein